MSNHTLYLVRLDSLRKNGKATDRKLAEYILSRPETLQRLTVQQLAELTDTSYATVCRFFRKLGTDGFREFKRILSSELQQTEGHPMEPPEFNIEADKAVSFSEIQQKICDYSASIVSSCGKFLHPSIIEQTVTHLKKADHIHFIGLGTSAVTAQYAYTKFFRLKPTCAFSSDIILAKMKAAQMKSGDILFAISSSGRTKSVLEIADLARQNGAVVISICDFANAPLANLAHISICTTVRESNKYIDTDFPLIQGQVTIIDILHACLHNRMPTPNIRKTQAAVSPDKVG